MPPPGDEKAQKDADTAEDPVLGIGMDPGGTPIELPLEALKKHYVCFGASGSGKTVLGKTLLEEFTRNGIPSIIIDPQGDLASLGLMGDQTSLVAHAVDLERAREFGDRAEVRIFTPASSKGIPIRVDLFRPPEADLPMEERVNAFDMTASSMAQLLGYDYESPKGKAARKFLYLILKTVEETGRSLDDISELVEVVREPDQIGLKPGSTIRKKDREALAIDLGHLTIGVEDLLFSHGVGMSMDTFLTPVQKGRTPVNVIYLNTLNTERHKHFFVANLCKELYSWMLKHPSERVQLVFYIDEVGPFMPPHPKNPPAKQMLKMLFKQGRKYGVSMMMCTQNIADIEYKALAQASTWALGRLMAQQDLGKVQHLIRSLPQEEYERIMEAIPKIKACNFALINSDLFREAVMMKGRWLYTQHRTLDEEALKGAMRPEVLDHFSDPLRMPPGEDIRPFVPVDDTATAAAGPEAGVEGGQRQALGGQWPSAGTDTMAEGHRTEGGAGGEGAAAPGIDPEESFVYVADVKVPQNEASKVLTSWSKRLMTRQEDVTRVDTEYLLLWRLRIRVEVKEGMIPFLSKKVDREENMYVEASRNLSTSGQLMQVEDTVRFSNVVSKQAHEIVDLDHNTEFGILQRDELPFDIASVPHLSRKEVERVIYNLFGARVLKARRVVYRVWRFTVRDGTTGKERFVRVDSVFGRPVEVL